MEYAPIVVRTRESNMKRAQTTRAQTKRRHTTRAQTNWGRVGALLALMSGCGVLHAAEGWTVLFLHPQGQGQSIANGVWGAQQVGGVQANYPSGPFRAAVWSGYASSWIDLHPIGLPGSSYASAVFDKRQGGKVDVGGNSHASMWSGSAATWIDLHPTGAASSWISAMNGDEQGGVVVVEGAAQHAALWRGNSDWIDLHTGPSSSSVQAVHSGRQAGAVDLGGRTSAFLWSGTAASAVELGPDSVDFSVVNGMDETHQVGFYWSPDQHACMWTGTKESFLDLNPTGSEQSIAWGAGSGYQVGAYLPIPHGAAHACIWSGSADSVVDLGDFAPGSTTHATSVWTQGQTIYVGGYIDNYPNGQEALLWVRMSPCPCDLNGDNAVDDEDFWLFAPDYDVLVCADPGMTVNCPSDLNADGSVDDGDFQIFAGAYARTTCE